MVLNNSKICIYGGIYKPKFGTSVVFDDIFLFDVGTFY